MPVSYQSDEPVETESCRRVMCAEVEWWNLRVFPRCKALLEERTSCWIQSSNRLQTITMTTFKQTQNMTELN